MADDSAVLKEYLVNVLFKVDDETVRKANVQVQMFEKQVEEVTERTQSTFAGLADGLGKFAAGAVGFGLLVHKTLSGVTDDLNDIWFAAKQAGANAEGLRQFELAARRVGVSAGEAQQQVTDLFESLQNPVQHAMITRVLGVNTQGLSTEQVNNAIIEKFRGIFANAAQMPEQQRMNYLYRWRMIAQNAGLDYRLLEKLGRWGDLPAEEKKAAAADAKAGITEKTIDDQHKLWMERQDTIDDKERNLISTTETLTGAFEKLTKELDKFYSYMSANKWTALVAGIGIMLVNFLGALALLKQAFGFLGVGKAGKGLGRGLGRLFGKGGGGAAGEAAAGEAAAGEEALGGMSWMGAAEPFSGVAGGTAAATGMEAVLAVLLGPATLAVIISAVIAAVLKYTGIADKMQSWGEKHALPGFDPKTGMPKFLSHPDTKAAVGNALGSVEGRMKQWGSSIKKFSNQYGVDPNLVAAVMMQESGGDPNAKTPTGATGLMQLTQKTAAAMGVRNRLDPQQSIAGGTKYLAELMAQSHGNAAEALARYYGKAPAHPQWDVDRYVNQVMGKYRMLSPGGGGQAPTISQQTTINVNGVGQPQAVALAVSNDQDRQNQMLLRNFQRRIA